MVLIANIDRKKVSGTFTIDPEKLFGKKDGYEVREIIPADYTYTVKDGLTVSKKKSFTNMKESLGTPVKAEFSKRGVRYFEVSKKK